MAAISTLDSSLVVNHFKCSICISRTFIGPPNVVPQCLHRFCQDTACINKSSSVKERCGTECTTCRIRISNMIGSRKDQLIESIVSENVISSFFLRILVPSGQIPIATKDYASFVDGFVDIFYLFYSAYLYQISGIESLM